MKKTFAYTECYKILQAKPDQDWKEFRKQYKTLIQKWHPDRFPEDSGKKHAAEKKLKDISKAYQQISNYYKKHAVLPPVEIVTEKIKTSVKTARPENEVKDESPQDTMHHEKPAKTLKKERKYTVFYGALVIAFIVYGLIELTPDDHSMKNNQDNFQNKENSSSAINETVLSGKYIDLEAQIQQANKDKKKIIVDQGALDYSNAFTYGSTISEVIRAQGTPTKTEQDIWYYGQSEVHFKDGVVTDWKRSVEDPLRIIITSKN